MLKSRVDDLGYMGFVARNNTLLKPMNASTWVREQFITFHLLYQGNLPSVKPIDGLDKMILLSWLRRKFSESDDERFVLHYWDLRMPNIIIDDDDNLIR